jgi:hypothetical protein
LGRNRCIVTGAWARSAKRVIPPASHQQREAVGKRVLGLDPAAPLGAGQAPLLRVEAHQAGAGAEKVAEPLGGQVAHVVGLDLVVPHPHAGGGLHGVERYVQRQHARGPQHHVLVPERGLDQRHARQLALGEHVAVRVDHHPGAVEVEAGFHQQGPSRRQAAATLDGVQVQGSKGADDVAQGRSERRAREGGLCRGPLPTMVRWQHLTWVCGVVAR